MKIKAIKKYTNKLSDQNSPYLLQHAQNPVNWYPWGREAFERAKKEDKPVFLSIGYSTCHWCHVMGRESFENEQIARIMNEHFISIKVDREQRPDIDQIYMNAVMMMTGSGGWPLSVFLTPDAKPFYGGTYFPSKDMYGRPGFRRLLLTIADAWKNKRQDLTNSADKISEFLESTKAPDDKEKLSTKMLENAFARFKETFDSINGGFGIAPKFPQPTNLLMLLCYWYRTKDKQALQMVEKTLDSMAKGGIYDHIGGGFHRYATDTKWLVSHFEKMLYDQAQLTKAYLQAYQITKKHEFATIAIQTFDYVLRDMTDAKGGFYSAEDADTQGKEGDFYLWEPVQIATVLDKEMAAIFNDYYGVTEKGNFEDGKTILHISYSIEQLAKKHKKNPEDVKKILKDARAKVFDKREKRLRPNKDDKIITAWNGLMISSLAYGSTVLQQQKYLKAAKRAAEFILNTLYKDGRLMRFYRNGKVIERAFLDDYAFMLMALMDLYEADFDIKWLKEAEKLSMQMIELFSDKNDGGLSLTGTDNERLITRTKPGSDGAIASGNSIAALAFLKLGRITGDPKLTEHGTKIVEKFSQQLQQSPTQSSVMLIALNFLLGPTQEIVIAGLKDAKDTKQMLEAINNKFLPNAVVLLHEQDNIDDDIYKIIPFIKNYTMIGEKATAYICENYVCNKGVNELDDLKKKCFLISQPTDKKSKIAIFFNKFMSIKKLINVAAFLEY